MHDHWLELSGLPVPARISCRSLGDLGPSGWNAPAQERRRLAGAVEASKLLLALQVHSLRIIVMPRNRAPEIWEGHFDANQLLVIGVPCPLPVASGQGLVEAVGRLDADGSLTNTPGLSCGVTVADCLPILQSHPDGWIGALHSGWGGTGILAVALAACRGAGLDLSRLQVLFGPCIAGGSYPVPPDRAALFSRRFGDSAVVRCADGQPGLDLVAANQAILAGTAPCLSRFPGFPVARGQIAPGIERAINTMDSPNLHSFRRDGAENYGRMLAMIGPAGTA